MMKIIKTILILILSINVAFAEKNIVVILDWFENPNHAPLFVAKDNGYFKEQGLSVKLVGPANPSDPPKLVAANKAEIAITYQPQLIEQINNGLPLIRIGTLIDKPLDCITVLASSDINSIKDLKNKRIGYSAGSMHQLVIKTMLEHHGLSLKDIKSVNVNFDLTQGLLAKKIDAATGMMRNFEIIQMELLNKPARIFLPEESGVPKYSELVFVSNPNNLDKKTLKKFLLALQQGVTYLKKNPEKSWQKFADIRPNLNNKLNKKAWFASINLFANNPATFNKYEWEQFIDFMYTNKLIKEKQSVDKYAIDLSKE